MASALIGSFLRPTLRTTIDARAVAKLRRLACPLLGLARASLLKAHRPVRPQPLNALNDHDHMEIRVSGKPYDPWPLLSDFQYPVKGVEVGTIYPFWSTGPVAKLCQAYLSYQGYTIAVDGEFGPESQRRP